MLICSKYKSKYVIVLCIVDKILVQWKKGKKNWYLEQGTREREITGKKQWNSYLQELYNPCSYLTHPYAGTHAPLGSYIRTTLHTHTHTHSPAHPYTHSCHSYTRTPQQLYRHHLCTPLHLQISTNINSCIHNTYLQISANIHTCIHLQISANIQSHTTVPINCTNAVNYPKVSKIHSLSITIYTFFFFLIFFLIPELKEYKLYKCWGHPATRTKDLKSKLGCVTN